MGSLGLHLGSSSTATATGLLHSISCLHQDAMRNDLSCSASTCPSVRVAMPSLGGPGNLLHLLMLLAAARGL